MRGPVRRSTTVRHAHTLLVGRTPSAKPRGIFACPNGQGLLCGKAICKCAFRSDLGAQRVKQSSQIVQVGTQHRSQAYPLAVRDITAAHRDGVCIATLKRKIRSRRHEPKGRNRQSLALVTARQPQSEPAARNSRSQHRNLEENPFSLANPLRRNLYIQTDEQCVGDRTSLTWYQRLTSHRRLEQSCRLLIEVRLSLSPTHCEVTPLLFGERYLNRIFSFLVLLSV